MKRVLLLALTFTLAGCSQSNPQTPNAGFKPGKLGRLALSADIYDTSPEAVQASDGYSYVTADLAIAQLRESGLQFTANSTTPSWVAPLLDNTGRFASGHLILGAPIEVASPVQLSMAEGSQSVSQRTLSQLGNAVLVPLHLNDGRIGGLARLPLYRKTAVRAATTEYILFEEPVYSLVREEEAMQMQSGRPTAQRFDLETFYPEPQPQPEILTPSVVFAVALDGGGSTYSPFDIRWAVIPADEQSQPVTLVPLGLPAFYTGQGERMLPSGDYSTSVASIQPTPLAEAQRVQESFAPPTSTPYMLERKKGWLQ